MKDKRIRGSVTIEASIALTFFMFFILTFLSFGSYHKAQNAMKHSLNQAAKTISLENKWDSTIEGIPFNLKDEYRAAKTEMAKLFAKIDPEFNGVLEEYETLQTSSEIAKTVKLYMAYYLTGEKPNDEAKAQKLFASMGIYEVKVKDITKTDDLITLSVSYKVHTRTSFFADDLEFTESISISLF